MATSQSQSTLSSAGLESDAPVLEGKLSKKGAINTGWKDRFFVLRAGRRLAYYETQKQYTKGKNCIKEIDLSDVHSIAPVPTLEEYRVKQATTAAAAVTAKSSEDITANYSVRISTDIEDFGDREDEQKADSRTRHVDRKFAFEMVTSKRTWIIAAPDKESFKKWFPALERMTFGQPLHSGWLTKRGAYRKSWKKRWFVIYDTQEMRYYDDNSRSVLRGMIKLHDVLLMCPGDPDQYNQPHTIQLMTASRNWVIALESEQEQELWFMRLEEVIHGAKRLITSYEGYMFKRNQQPSKHWRKRYFALSKGWLFYFDEQFYCNKFKSIAFFSEAFFNQAFRLYVKGSIPLHQTTIQKVESESDDTDKKHIFRIKTDKREFYFACDSERQLQKWFTAFHNTHSDGWGSITCSAHDTLDNDTEIATFVKMNSISMSLTRADKVRLTTDFQEFDDDNSGSDKEEKVSEAAVIAASGSNDANTTVDEAVDSSKGGHKKDESSSSAILNLIDPNGDGKWLDLEDPSLIQQQGEVVSRMSRTFEHNKILLTVSSSSAVQTK